MPAKKQNIWPWLIGGGAVLYFIMSKPPAAAAPAPAPAPVPANNAGSLPANVTVPVNSVVPQGPAVVISPLGIETPVAILPVYTPPASGTSSTISVLTPSVPVVNPTPAHNGPANFTPITATPITQTPGTLMPGNQDTLYMEFENNDYPKASAPNVTTRPVNMMAGFIY